MANEKGPNIKKKQKCKNCEGKGLLKKGVRTLCVHGDNPQAVAFVRYLRTVLIEQGIAIRKFSP